MQKAMAGDALGYYCIFLKTNVNCISGISPLENKPHEGVCLSTVLSLVPTTVPDTQGMLNK